MIETLIAFATSLLGASVTGGTGVAAMIVAAFIKKWKPVALWGGGAVIVLSAFLYGYHVADNRADMRSKIATLEQDILNKSRDLENERQRAAEAQAERDRLANIANEMNEKVADYAEKLTRQPVSAACSIDDADLRLRDRLRNNEPDVRR